MYTDHTQASYPYLDYHIIHVHRPPTGFPSISGLPYHTCTQTTHRLPTHIWTTLSYMYTDHTQASDPYLDYPIIHVHRPHTGFPSISGLPYHTCTQTTHRLPTLSGLPYHTCKQTTHMLPSHIWTTLSYMYTDHTQASHPYLNYPIIHVHRLPTGFPSISGLPYHTCTQTTHRLPTQNSELRTQNSELFIRHMDSRYQNTRC